VLGRMYLITDEQFNDVVMQENSVTVDGRRFVPAYEQILRERNLIFSDDSLYGRLLTVGIEGGHPIVAFTTARTNLQANTRAPSQNYVKIIASGIKEAYPQMTNAEIVAYFLRADGVHGKNDLMKIDRWIRAA
jgi:hypothetical protein